MSQAETSLSSVDGARTRSTLVKVNPFEVAVWVGLLAFGLGALWASVDVYHRPGPPAFFEQARERESPE
jgi:hypothetical protein